MKNNKNTLGNRIKVLREEKSMSQQQLADSLYVSNKTISKWEMNNSEPDTSTLIKLADIFNVTLDYLLKGETIIKEVDSISKMELACREDNIALLEGLDIDAFDDKGRDIEFYAKEHNAKNILDYIKQIKLEKAIENYTSYHKNDKPTCYICALEEGETNEESLRLVMNGIKREDVPLCCLDLEKQGYHNFKIFTRYQEKDLDYCSIEYQDMLMSVLGDDGRKNLSIGWGFLNDGESAVVQIYYPKKEGNNIFEYFANKTEMEKVIKVLEEIDFKHWKNRHWGMPIYYVNYLDKGSLTNDGCPPGFFYVNPPKESYLKLVKALMTLCFNIMKPKQYRRFAIYFNDSCEPYYRQKMKLEESRKLFKEIEYERTAPGREFE